MARVTEDQLLQIKRWGDRLLDDRREEVRAAGRAIAMLVEEIEALNAELRPSPRSASAAVDDRAATIEERPAPLARPSAPANVYQALRERLSRGPTAAGHGDARS